MSLIGATGCGPEPKADRKPAKKEKKIETIADLGALPLEVSYPADNPHTPEKEHLGRMLFFDPILSGNKEVSCASCHKPEFNYSEFLETSHGIKGSGIPFLKRNSQSVLNTAFNGITNRGDYDPMAAPMFWDSRASSLEEQSLEPIKALEEMRGGSHHESDILNVVIERLRNIQEYRDLFTQAFPGEKAPVNQENLAKAIATFERGLVANNSRFDQYMRGDDKAMSTNEKEGLRLFLSSGCAKCHNGPMFSDFKMHALGAPDTKNWPTTDSGLNGSFAFRTPTLRNLNLTAPYMHSGKFQTLKQVLEFYEDLSHSKVVNPNVPSHMRDTLLKDLNVEFRDISLIVEFLGTLNDTRFDKTVPERVPSGLKPGGISQEHKQ